MSSSRAQKCAVVVPVHNEEAVIGRLLDALGAQTVLPDQIIVVNNASTDATAHIVRKYTIEHPKMKVQIIDEPQKGTGSACDTGFREAIRAGYELLIRTDADCVPEPEWVESLLASAGDYPDAQLFTGRLVPLRDGWYRRGDRMLLPTGFFIIRVVLALRRRDRAYMRLAIGSNLMIRARAYSSVNGFPRVGFEHADEDVELSLQVHRQFGRSAIQPVHDARVTVSMRRPRTQGAWKTLFRHIYTENRHAGPLHDIR